MVPTPIVAAQSAVVLMANALAAPEDRWPRLHVDPIAPPPLRPVVQHTGRAEFVPKRQKLKKWRRR